MTVGSVVTAMIEYLHGNLHEVEHLLKVYGYAKAIGEEDARTFVRISDRIVRSDILSDNKE